MLHKPFCGQRVQIAEIADGILAGEKGIIRPNPESGEWYSDEMVWIHFDHYNHVYGKEKGYAIMSEQWYEVERLKAAAS